VSVKYNRRLFREIESMARLLMRKQVSGLRAGANGSPSAMRPRLLFLARLALALICCVTVYWWFFGGTGRRPIGSRLPTPVQAHQPSTLRELLSTTPVEIGQRDIASMDLLCAEGLPGAERLDVQDCLATLDRWADRVRSETQRHSYRYRTNPGEFENSEGYFRMLMMAVVLYEDFSVRYNPERISGTGRIDPDDRFSANSRDLFLHGLLAAEHGDDRIDSPQIGFGSSPAVQHSRVLPQSISHSRPLGTCSSMPVLYVAIGRRLGYPLKLVTTKAHLFIRWEGATERFNLEATGRGMNRYDDEHFKRWPFPVTEDEIRADGYLKSLAPAEELALFLSLRGHCLKEAGRTAEAAGAYAEATRFAPDARPYQLLRADAQHPAAARPAASAAPPPAVSQTGFSPGAANSTSQPGMLPDVNPLLKIRQQ
jgi:hypothetical protein